MANHLESLGYGVIDITEPEDNEGPFFYPQVDKVERHTPESLQTSGQKLCAIDVQFGIADYDDMNVVAVLVAAKGRSFTPLPQWPGAIGRV